MVRIIAVGVLLLGVVGIAVVGCGPRAEVAKDKIIAQIDKVLGELDVKRKKIEINQQKLVGELADLREKRIGTQVRLEQLQKKKDASVKSLDKIKTDIGQLIARGKEVESSETKSITVKGKEYNAEDITRIATELTLRHKTALATVKNFDSSIQALSDSVSFLETAEKKAKEAMSKLNAKISEIDSKKIAVDAVRSATEIGNSDSSILDRINSLDKEIEDMFVDVETAMRVEQDKLDSMQSETSSADALLSVPVDLNSKLDELSNLIGEGADDDGN